MTIPLEKSDVDATRAAFGIGGVLALVTGILILVSPGRTAMVAAAIIAMYAIASGLVYAGLGIFSKQKGGWARVGHILLGVIFVVAGIVSFTNLALTAESLALFLGILVGIMWLVEGVVALSTLNLAPSKGWTIFYAVVSILAGISLLFTPVLGALVLWWMLGISAIVLGVVQIGRAFTFGK